MGAPGGQHGKIELEGNLIQKPARNILFVCSANQCRSPMAEALFRNLILETGQKESDWGIHSAGCWATYNNPATYYSILTMQNMGIDLTNHRSQPVTASLLDEMQLVLCMESDHVHFIKKNFPEHAKKIFLLSEIVNDQGDVEDPVYYPMEVYQQTAQYLYVTLKSGFNKILQLTHIK